mgnify:CR=1 FL=1
MIVETPNNHADIKKQNRRDSESFFSAKPKLMNRDMIN